MGRVYDSFIPEITFIRSAGYVSRSYQLKPRKTGGDFIYLAQDRGELHGSMLAKKGADATFQNIYAVAKSESLCFTGDDPCPKTVGMSFMRNLPIHPLK